MNIEQKTIIQSKKRLVGPDNHEFKCSETVQLEVYWNKTVHTINCYVCKGVTKALLGRPEITSLQMLNIKFPTNNCAAVQSKSPFLSEFPDVFQGLGKISGEPISIKLQEGAVPYHI